MNAMPLIAAMVVTLTQQTDKSVPLPNAAARAFGPAVEQIKTHIRVPILLPSRLARLVDEREVKLSRGEVTKDGGYCISLYSTEAASPAGYLARVCGSALKFALPVSRRVVLPNGDHAEFNAGRCWGGRCESAHLWWTDDDDYQYSIRMKVRPNMNEKEQEQILLDMADSMVVAK